MRQNHGGDPRFRVSKANEIPRTPFREIFQALHLRGKSLYWAIALTSAIFAFLAEAFRHGSSQRRAQRFGGGFFCRRNHSIPLQLEAGRTYPLRIDYSHGEGQAGIHLMWQSRTQDRQHVPTRFLITPAAGQ